MTWLDRLENRFGHLAVPGLPRIIVGLTAIVYVLSVFNPEYLNALALIPRKVMEGEVWRLFTFLFIPTLGGVLPDWFYVLLYLLFIYFIGNGLEQAMGAFRLNLYYLLGAIGIAVAGFLFGGGFGNAMLNTSLLFAFARYYPDSMIYIMFILPAKVIWLAWLTAALLLWNFIFANWDFRMAVLVSFLNFWLFFGAEIIRDFRQRREVSARRERFVREAQTGTGDALHECSVCKRTEATAPELEFRVARDGHEYCLEHLPKVPAAGSP